MLLPANVATRVCIAAVLVLIASATNAQNRNNHWAICGGQNAIYPGSLIGSMSGTPIILDTIGYVASESYSVMSDTSGNLLFYTGKREVYRPDGTSLYYSLGAWGNGDVTQGQLILPRPGDGNLYDVILIDSGADSSISELVKPKAIHVVVDISANGGTGAVVGDEVSFGYNLTEKLTGTPHVNGNDYWVLMHEWKSDKFLAHQLTSAGLDTVPVISHVGTAHSAAYGDCDHNMNTQGEMKFSYLGDHVALCTQNPFGCPNNDDLQPNIVQLFHFNDATGVVTYWLTLPEHSITYGIEFSQDGSKLYVPGTDAADRYVDQYDLAAGDTTAVRDSRTRIFSTPYNGVPGSYRPNAMELAPNGKIYVSHTGSSLDAINEPDQPGLACDYVVDALPLPNYHYFGAHNNQIKRYHDSEYKRDDVGLGAELSETHFAIWPNPASQSIRLRMPANLASPRMRIHDSTGRLLREVSGQVALSGSMDVSGLASGMYTVSLLDGSAVVGQARLVVP